MKKGVEEMENENGWDCGVYDYFLRMVVLKCTIGRMGHIKLRMWMMGGNGIVTFHSTNVCRLIVVNAI